MHPAGAAPPLWTVLPFATLLLSIALLPLVRPTWWESHRRKAVIAILLAWYWVRPRPPAPAMMADEVRENNSTA